MKPAVLILCTGNSCRSLMGGGILRSLACDILNAQSTGSRPAGYVHPMEIEVLREIGIVISKHDSKILDQRLHQSLHTVSTVCGHVDQICQIFPQQVERIHPDFDDPAHADGSPEEIRDAFRRGRVEMRVFSAGFVTRFTPAPSGNQPIPT